MKRRAPMCLVWAPALVFSLVLFVFAATAGAQTDDPLAVPAQDPAATDLDPGGLDTSNAQVRRAILGLLSVAGLTTVVGLAYWHFSGADARRRFAAEFPHATLPESRLIFGRSDQAGVVGARERLPAGDAPAVRREPRKRGQRRQVARGTPAGAPIGRHAKPASAEIEPVHIMGTSEADRDSLWSETPGRSRAGRGWPPGPSSTGTHHDHFEHRDDALFEWDSDRYAEPARNHRDDDDLFGPE